MDRICIEEHAGVCIYSRVELEKAREIDPDVGHAHDHTGGARVKLRRCSP